MSEKVDSGEKDNNRELTAQQKKLKKEYIKKYVKTTSPIDTACFLPKMFFTWANPIMKISQKVPFSEDMIYSIQKQRSSEVEIVTFKQDFETIFAKKKEEVERTKYEDETEKPNI